VAQTVTDVHPRAGIIAADFLFLSERNGSISIRHPTTGAEVLTCVRACARACVHE
jgi:hypothetical protein